ncbi:MAG TPA: lytic transglycosylase domain-containing protein [Clostridiaceae bacterium]
MKIDSLQSLLQSQLIFQLINNQNQNKNNGFSDLLEKLLASMVEDGSNNGTNSASNLYQNQVNTKEPDTLANGETSSIDAAVSKASAKYGVDKKLIESVINQESSFNAKAISSAGAMGLMQLMPGTAKELGVKDAFNAAENIDGGTKYLKSLLDMYGNSKELALAAYNAGPNALKRNGVDDKSEINRLSTETRNYVSMVTKYYNNK